MQHAMVIMRDVVVVSRNGREGHVQMLMRNGPEAKTRRRKERPQDEGRSPHVRPFSRSTRAGHGLERSRRRPAERRVWRGLGSARSCLAVARADLLEASQHIKPGEVVILQEIGRV